MLFPPVAATACPHCGFPFLGVAPHEPVRLKLIIGVISAVLVVGTTALFVLQYLVTSTGAYRQAITIAQSSPEVRSLVGDGIKAQVPVVGFVNASKGGEFTVFSARVTGSKGSGHLYGVANAVNGSWEFSRLSLHLDHTAQSIDITPAPPLLALSPVPDKRVYLVPIGLDAGESLDWAPAYYKAKFGIDVEVLPPAPLSKDLEDPRRHQIESEQLLTSLSRSYSELLRDPSNVLLGVTSHDIFIRSFGWAFAENYRAGARVAVVSDARFRPAPFVARWNPEWLHSRLQKMLTKNVAVLYFDLPMSSDYTSLLSGGRLTGREVDLMSGSIIGAEGAWDPFIESGDLETSVYVVPGKPPFWRLASAREVLPQTSAHLLNADLTIGLFVDRKADFFFDGDYPLQFIRVYRNKDPQSRPFGIGTSDSMDIFLVGQMGRYIDLVFEDGGRIHFVHAPMVGQEGDTYQGERADGSPFSRARAVYAGGNWTVERSDGWKFYFPYRPQARGPNVTVLTGFSDPSEHKYEMLRDEFGDLLSVTTPSGDWLHFQRDVAHRVRSIAASSGRAVTYDYDAAGRLTHVTDSDGNQESYAYDDKAQMLAITLGGGRPTIENTYDIAGNIVSQLLSNGGRFQYHYVHETGGRGEATVPDMITAPNGLLTHVLYQNDEYTLSLPLRPQQ